MTLTLSALSHTWILDLDGTIVEHNGYKKYGQDRLLDGAKEFLASIPEEDMVIFITSRTEEYRKKTEDFLKQNSIRYSLIIWNAPYGERILINDSKPSGLKMSYSINKVRNEKCDITLKIDGTI